MATKKQKRLAGEARAAERDAAHAAEIERRKVIAKRRTDRRLKREAEQERRAQNIAATKAIRGGVRPRVEEPGDGA